MSNNTLAVASQSQKPSALAVMANRFNVEPKKLLETLKDTVFKNASDSELLALVVVANEYGLNPLLKEIYAFPAKGGGITPIVSIDGWISMVNRQPQLDGISFDMSKDGEECTCRIFIKNRAHPVEVTEYKSECYRGTEPWKMMPKRMLRHKALIQAARVAFGFSGIYDEEEAQDIIKRANAREVMPAATSTPIDPFAEIEKPAEASAPVQVADYSEPPPFVPDTPQKALQVAISDAGVVEAKFMAAFRKQSSAVVGKAKLISELSDEAAIVGMDGINDLIALAEGEK